MKVAITGSSGLVGRALSKRLESEGHEVFALVRGRPKGNSQLEWNPATGQINLDKLIEMDAIVHLAGENIADKKWTDKQKALIHSSRVNSTRKLSQTLALAVQKGGGPKVFITASAIGFYGGRGEEVLTESSDQGTGFLASLCKDWEEATKPAEAVGVRVAHARISMVLSTEGGALGKLLPIFDFGAGGNIGDGKQYMSWIDIDDLSAALVFLLTSKISGSVNMAAPNPVPNAEFTKILANVLQRPAFLPVPPFALRLMMGELADELLLASQRVMPEVLQSSGFVFTYPDLESSLRHVLNKQPGELVSI